MANTLQRQNRTKKLILLSLFVVIILFLIFVSTISNINSGRKLPPLYTKKTQIAVRGKIVSKDNFLLSKSIKLYKATIFMRCLDADKKSLFVKLFSIYSGINKNKIEKKINNSIKDGKTGTIILSHNIGAKKAQRLKQLSRKLLKLGVFKSTTINGHRLIIGLDIKATGEKRIYPYKDSFAPLLGYTKKYEDKKNITRVKGFKGLEQRYQSYLGAYKNGFIKGERDLLSNISLNKATKMIYAKDGANIHLTIPLRLQKNIEKILDFYKKKFGAKEVIASIMRSDTGEIMAMASSNRYNPQNIKRRYIFGGHMGVNAVSYTFEPGSVIKPLSISLVLQNKLVKKEEKIKAHNKSIKNLFGSFGQGKYTIGKYTITDDHKFNKNELTVRDILVHSSNIGTLILAQRLSAKQFLGGYQRFGLSKKTGIDIAFERKGKLHSQRQYSIGSKTGADNIYKATDSYGHGITATFIQLLQAYTVFNNAGLMSKPKIVEYIQIGNEKINIQNKKPVRVIDKQVANYIKDVLIDVVRSGTGKNTYIKNIQVGGKTGTASIAKSGKYTKSYNSSFFGFANDKQNRYTIGVTIREPGYYTNQTQNFYASSTAVPVYDKIVKALLVLGFLSVED
ncbi:MAG: penicillin-binding protein 2 [Epsilonproteobacteria bacterium]|nr:MAG: penicillin-binding protein 2 [Campylobacterota bacterium]